MKRTLLVILIMLIATMAFASVDYKCQQDCLNKGYMYSYCQDRCSYDYSYPTERRTDYKCLNDCVAKGYMYNYCRDYCSY